MDLVDVDLALMTCLDVAVTINLHGHLVITGRQDFLYHGVSTGMCLVGSLVNFHYDLVCFLHGHTSKQNRIIISLV